MEEELDNVNVDSKKPTEKNRKKSIANVAKLKKIASNKKDKEARLNRRADRIAARKGLEGSGVFNEDGNPDNESLMKARKKGRKIIADRKAARKQYLRNFASQLARGEQATPRTGFGEGEDNPNANTSLSGNSGTKNEVKTNKEIQDSEARNILSMIDKGEPNKFLNFNSAADDALADVMNTNINLTSGINKVEDSTPITYMQKQYRKKRGY